MASSTSAPLASATDDPTHASNNDESPFLKLAPELRNRIYDFTFKAAGPSSPVPHALTRTNRQIRSECRAMYYASIEYLEIPLRTLAQIRQTQKWLAEEDWSMFPVLPGLVFFSYHPGTASDITYLCEREEIVPAHEFSLRLDNFGENWGLSDQDKREIAVTDTCVKCLGVDPDDITYCGTIPNDSIRAIEEGDTHKWAVRGWCSDSVDLTTEWRDVWHMFFENAEEMQGDEWDRSTINWIVFWLEENGHYRDHDKPDELDE